MEYTPQEQEILKKLNIDNFRQLKKENFIELTSMLDKIDPEVAMKIIEQYPEFAKTSLEVVREYQIVVDKALDSNKVTQKAVLEACQRKLAILEKMLEKESLTLDDQKFYLSEWDKIIKDLSSLDEKNKKWLGDLLATLGKFSLGVLSLGIVALSGNKLLKK